MLVMILVIVGSLLISLILTPFCRDFFGLLGIVDKPDSPRKTHVRAVPRVGGIVLAISYLAAVIAMGVGWWRGVFTLDDPSIRLMLKLTPAMAIIFLTGLVDDLRGLSPWWKLGGQTGAAVYACWVGVHLATPAG